MALKDQPTKAAASAGQKDKPEKPSPAEAAAARQRFATLAKYSNVYGISGHENEAAKTFALAAKPLVDRVESDNLGSVIAIKGDKGPKLMIAAHVDEIGFIVAAITKDGFIKINPVGGWWGHNLLGKRLIVLARNGKQFKGTVGSKPPHILTPAERTAVLTPDKMVLDIGANSKEQVIEAGITVGDPIVKDSELFQSAINPEWVCGKSLDDRAAVAALEEALHLLKGKKLNCQLFAVATTQEEVGLRGATTAAQKINPDVGIAIDVTISSDAFGMDKEGCKLNDGVTISVMDNSIISNPRLVRYVEDVCKQHKIKFTHDALLGGGTDGGAIHKVHDGVITVVLSIPSRYIHSHNEVVSLNDLRDLAKLLAAFVEGFDEKALAKLAVRY